MKQKTNFKQTEFGMIPKNWKVQPLSQITHIIGGGTPKTSNPNYWNGSIPWISINDFVGDIKKIYKTTKTITEKGLQESSTKLLHKGQLVISARGTVGEIGQVTKDMAFNQSCYGLDGKNAIQNDFLYYLLKFKIKDLQSNTHGSVFNTITRNTFDQIIVQIPEKNEQATISKILSDLDSKIELNRNMNQILEQISQTIFKSWFVDYEFPDENGKPYKSSDGEMEYNEELGKEIPKGWELKALDKIVIFINGLPLQKFRPTTNNYLPVIKIREMKNGFSSNIEKARVDLEKKYVVENGDILFSWSGTLELMMWHYGKGALNQHIFKVISEKYEKWFYYEWIRFHLPRFCRIAEGKVTTMGHIQRHHLSEALITIPSSKILEKMNGTMNLIFEKLLSNNISIQNLIKIRDSLLPKLMSGKIRV